MRRSAAVLVFAGMLAACGGGGDAGPPAATTAGTSAAPPPTAAGTPMPPAGTPMQPPAGSPPAPSLPSAALPAVTGGTAWSDPATWGGTVPPAGATVLIPPGKTVVLDVQTPALKGLTIEGTLVAGNADVGITSDYVYIKGGRLQIGSAEKPFLRNAVITLTGSTTTDNAATPGFGSKVLAVMGGVLELHGRPVAKSWTKLDGGDVAAGAKEIKLAEAPGWKAGDQIVIATSGFDQDEYSLADVESVDGATVTLRTPTKFKHFGIKRQVGDISVDVRAEVGLLTHNIVVQGDAASTANNIGGHAMFMAGDKGATIQIANTQLQRMGQLDRSGRYPLHFHLMGNGCNQCYLRNNAVRDTVQRGIVLHDTSNVMVAGNVVFNTVGHNIVIETETTAGNTLNGNLALVNRQPKPLHTDPALLVQNDRLPGNYWMRGADNAIINNVAAGSLSNGFVYDAPGAGNFHFRNNVIHAAMQKEGAGAGDFDIAAGLMIIASRPEGHQDQILDTLVYHSGFGIWPEESSVPYVIDRFIVAENLTGVQNRGVGSKQIYRNGVFIGKLPDSTALVRAGAAMHNQYGSDNLLENPTFANYAEGVGLGGTDTGPTQSSYRLTNGRFIGPNTGVQFGDLSRVTFTDDTLMPRGFYVDASAPWLATPGCPTVAAGEARLFRCAAEPGAAELEVRLAPDAGFGQKIAASLLRSDGLRYAIGAGLASGVHSTTVLHGVPATRYQLEQTSAYYAAKLWDTGGDALVMADKATVPVALSVSTAPRTVARTGFGHDAIDPPTATNALRAAANQADWDANPLTSYFYDAAAKKVWVNVSSRWVVVAQ